MSLSTSTGSIDTVFGLAQELAHRLLHRKLWRQIQFQDIASWKAAVTDSIPEREYGYVEFHANFFAGLVLVPAQDLEGEFRSSVERAKEAGVDVMDENSGARDLIESYVARQFQVSRDVVHRRLDADGLWKCGPNTSPPLRQVRQWQASAERRTAGGQSNSWGPTGSGGASAWGKSRSAWPRPSR